LGEVGKRDAGRSFYNFVGGKCISERQIDELIGLAHGLAADGSLNQAEVEFLQKWLATNAAISDGPVIPTLYRRVLVRASLTRPRHCGGKYSPGPVR
jgi:hypothetical protein